MAETTHKPSYIIITDPATGRSVVKPIKHSSTPNSFHSTYDYLKYFAFDYTPVFAIAGGMIVFLSLCFIVKKGFRLLTGKSDSYYTVTTYKIKR